jgi:hypothetical protein
LTISTRIPKRGYFISLLRGVFDRLKAIGFAQIAILIAGLIILALCALITAVVT